MDRLINTNTNRYLARGMMPGRHSFYYNMDRWYKLTKNRYNYNIEAISSIREVTATIEISMSKFLLLATADHIDKFDALVRPYSAKYYPVYLEDFVPEVYILEFTTRQLPEQSIFAMIFLNIPEEDEGEGEDIYDGGIYDGALAMVDPDQIIKFAVLFDIDNLDSEEDIANQDYTDVNLEIHDEDDINDLDPDWDDILGDD